MSERLARTWDGIRPERLKRRLVDLVEIYSPSGKEEDIQLYLEEALGGPSAVRRQPVEEERFNLLAWMGDSEPRLWLVGHVDTVAASDLEELRAREEGENVCGLGTADMKGGCAAMVEAWLALSALPAAERPPLGLLLVVGEEENGDGSAAFLRERRPPWVIIGEPTSLAPCFSHFGYMEGGFVTRGRRIHSSLPELGHNAVESMLRVLLHLARDPLFDRSRSGVVYSIREMTSARAGFVVPDRCEARIDFHLPPEITPEMVMAAIRRRGENASALIPDLNLELEFDFLAPGYHLPTENFLGAALRGIYARLGLSLRFDAFRSHSDGNLFYAAGTHPLILGPGALEVAHTPEEQTSFAEVLAAAKIYAALALAASRPRGPE